MMCRPWHVFTRKTKPHKACLGNSSNTKEPAECLTAGGATYGYSAEVTDGVSATLVEMNAKPVFVVVKMYILCSMNLAPPPDIWGLTNGMFQRLIFYYIENHTLLRGGVIDGSKSAHGQTAAHGRHFCPANFPAKKVPMGSAQQTEFMSLK